MPSSIRSLHNLTNLVETQQSRNRRGKGAFDDCLIHDQSHVLGASLNIRVHKVVLFDDCLNPRNIAV